MRQLFPTHHENVDVGALYGVHRMRSVSRPFVVMSMISTLDGATSLDGRSTPLGGTGDRAVFAALRDAADVLLVGAATVRGEGYRSVHRPGQRLAVVTRTGQVDQALIDHPATVLIVPSDSSLRGPRVIVAGEHSVDLAAALAALDGDVVSCEGGPVLNGQMLTAGLVDELCLTISPRLVAGESSRIARHPDVAESSRWHLAHLLHDDEGFLYGRYLRRPA